MDSKNRKKHEQSEMAQFLRRQHEVRLTNETLQEKLLNKNEFVLNKKLLEQAGVINHQN